MKKTLVPENTAVKPKLFFSYCCTELWTCLSAPDIFSSYYRGEPKKKQKKLGGRKEKERIRAPVIRKKGKALKFWAGAGGDCVSEGIRSSTEGRGAHSGPGGSEEAQRSQGGRAPFEAARRWT